jgi:hypothetical protein
VRDIYELIRQRETEVDRFQKEIERVQKELEALRLTAKLLDDSGDAVTRPVVEPAPVVAREVSAYGTTPVTRPTATPTSTPGQTPSAWASAKQFP